MMTLIIDFSIFFRIIASINLEIKSKKKQRIAQFYFLKLNDGRNILRQNYPVLQVCSGKTVNKILLNTLIKDFGLPLLLQMKVFLYFSRLIYN